MRVSLTTRIVCSVIAGVVPLMLNAGDNGGPVVRRTGGKGDDPMACASAGCHTGLSGGGPINAHGGSVTATFSQGSAYTPGTPVQIQVRVADPVNSRTYGFQMSARPENDLENGQAGRFVVAPGIGVLCDDGGDGFPRLPNGNCPAFARVEFIEHTRASSSSTFTFSWMPPADGSGPVHFYLAGNATNGNGSKDEGDHIYTNSYVLEQPGPCVVDAPVINKVISPKGFGARTDFTSNTWIEITGKNFSSTTRLWQGLDFDGVKAPLVNDRVRVKVNGKDAAVWFISPEQINVNTPDNEGEGPMEVVVTNCEQSSAPYTLTQHRQAPGLLAPPDVWMFNDRQYAIAYFLGELVFVGDIPLDVASRPAKPGDLITLYGVGFGATNPPVPAGTIATGAASLVEPVTLKIGATEVPSNKILYAGISAGSVGLYQVTFEMPDVPNGDHKVEMRIGGELVPPEAYLTVRR
jgi:uncharacterized protein (TIGR03437 family)